jgi:von Willebrand factor type A domain/F5/8 type C domain
MANFPNIVNAPCVSTAPPAPNPSCSDPAYALANPQICGNAPTLRIKPGILITCALGSVQFQAFTLTNGVESQVTTGVSWSVSDMTVALIGAVSGNATGIGVGEVTVTATYQGLTGTATLTVLSAPGAGASTQPLIPTMTSDTTPAGQSSASSTFGGGDGSYLAFDGNQNTFWGQAGNGPSWLQYKFAAPTVATIISLFGDYSAWTLLGSNDGLNFVSLTTGPTSLGAPNGTNVVTFSNTVAYQYYQVNFAGDSAVTTMQLFTAAAGCCQGEQVNTVLVVDKSYSMSLAFGGGFTTKQAFADNLASNYANQTNTSKDQIALVEFDTTPTTDSGLTTNAAAVAGQAAAIVNTKNLTGIGLAIQAAVGILAGSTAANQMIVLITDGEDKDTVPADDPIAISTAFKTGGGILVCVGVRAHGQGFNLLNAISTGGFFINCYPAVAAQALQQVYALKGYLCGGNCAVPGNQFTNQPELIYNTLENWNQTGTLSLIGNGSPPLLDVLPGNGLYLGIESAVLTSKAAFTFLAGKTYDIIVTAAGNQMAPNTAAAFTIQIGTFQQTVAIPVYTQGFQSYSFAFTPQVTVTAPIVISAVPTGASQSLYLLLIGSVELDDVTDLTQMFFDNFDQENLQYTLPGCGGGVKILPTSPTVTDITGAGCADADATAFLGSASISDTMTVNAICTLVTSLKSAGVWALMDAIYPFVGLTSTTQSYNLKNPSAYRITWRGNMSFSAAGPFPNDATGYGDTGFNPNTAISPNYTLNSASQAMYGKAMNGGMGAQDVTNIIYASLVSSAGGSTLAGLNDRATEIIPGSGSNGFVVGTRTSSSSKAFYSPSGNATYSVNSTSMPAGNFFVCGYNLVGFGIAQGNTPMSFAAFGAALSPTQKAAMAAAVLTFETTFSRN